MSMMSLLYEMPTFSTTSSVMTGSMTAAISPMSLPFSLMSMTAMMDTMHSLYVMPSFSMMSVISEPMVSSAIVTSSMSSLHMMPTFTTMSGLMMSASNTPMDIHFPRLPSSTHPMIPILTERSVVHINPVLHSQVSSPILRSTVPSTSNSQMANMSFHIASLLSDPGANSSTISSTVTPMSSLLAAPMSTSGLSHPVPLP